MSSQRRFASLAALAVASTALTGLVLPSAQAATDASGLVISEAYGGGGNSGATYTHDFVELYNPTDAAISVSGLSIQYRSATGTAAAGSVTALTGSVPAKSHYLVQMAAGTGGTTALPTPDATGSAAMSGSGFQVWLANGTQALNPPAGNVAGTAEIIDFVGAAANASSFEGAAGPAPSNTAAVTRTAIGTDTDNNGADLSVAAPTPTSTGGAVEPEPEPDPVARTIPEIQGTGAVSPYVDTSVITEGVVTAAYPSGGLFGFYLQVPGTGGELDLATHTTSQALFVRQSAGAVAVTPGQQVRVTGVVNEYAGATQVTIANAAAVEVLGAAAPVVPTTTAIWPASDAQKESLEGMLYRPSGDFTVNNTYYGSKVGQADARFGEVGLAQGTTPLIQPTEVADAQDAAAIAAVVADNAARAITLDDGASTNFANKGDLTPPYVSQSDPVTVGARATFTAPVIFTQGGAPAAPSYRFQPTASVLGPQNSTSPVTFGNVRTNAPDEDRIAAEGEPDLKVASFNVLNYFTTLGDADDDNVGEGGCTAYRDRDGDGNNVNDGCAQRGAWDPADLARQQAKIVQAINSLDADVVGLMEIENSAALGEQPDEATQSLVAALNAAAGAGTWAANPSSADLPAAAEQDVITNAIIYKPAAVKRVGDAVALGDQSSGSGAFSNAREPIGQVFEPVSGGKQFLYVVNHFKSKGSGTDDGTGQGNANPDRIRQAEALRDWVAGQQQTSGVEAVLLGGDFNAYTQEDPLQVLYAAGFADATEKFGADEWSYVFDGLSGSLDHILLNEAAAELTTGSDVWNINAGESILFEYSRWNYHATDFHADTPYRSSDHDPVIVGLDLSESGTEPVDTTTTLKVAPAKVTAGRATTATVRVDAGAEVTPSGVVEVRHGAKVLATGALNAGGVATIKLPAFTESGSYPLTAVYRGDETAAASSSSVVTLRVEKAKASVRGVVSPKKVRVHRTKAELRVAVRATGLQPSGTISVKVGGRTIKASVKKGVATLKLGRFVRVGKVRLVLRYSGDRAVAQGTATVMLRIRR
ncbi:ExeM/NucH family extracellular endonuclease [Nocardioides sp. Bht2]|uniref:ExeM/NucH family extracellular endonuclease n=1 Tax=Nocardioides sp. Bht2 TaxID=3392297 RepID=UPI0039B5F3CC